MRILITNDDGIESPALPRLAKWAQKLGDVTVVAPKTEQSGKSQAIDFRRQVEIKQVVRDGIAMWAMDSTPADCVRFGVRWLKAEYDLVISGINRGLNLGHDMAYSGTIGAILEAGRLGLPAIALSTDVDSFDNALSELDAVYGYITERRLFDYAGLYNVNIPSTPSRGMRITRQGGTFYTDDFISCGNDLYLQVGEPVTDTEGDLSVDIDALRSGYVSITPLTATKTDLVAFDVLKGK